VARPYQSSLRADQTLLTRQRILKAARQHFLDRGWAGTTMKSIAGEAAVAAATVYAVFGTKRGVLSALIDEVLTEVAEPDLDWWRNAIGHPQQAERARQLVDLLARILPRVAPLERLVREAVGADEEIAGLARDLQCWRREAYAVVVGTLAGEEGLTVDADDAADRLFAFAGPEVYDLLVGVRGWSRKRFNAHVTALVAEMLPSSSPA
jgi:AcrR family transcriptional regulator